MKSNKSKKAAVWISTVLYILIALSVIGLLIAAISPKIAEMKDNFIIQQTLIALNDLDSTIFDAMRATGNTRDYNLRLSRGTLTIYSQEDLIENGVDRIEWNIQDSAHELSEPGTPVPIGRITATTTENGDLYSITLAINYPDLNLTVEGVDAEKIVHPASSTQLITIKNEGAPFLDGGGRGPVEINMMVD